MNVMLHPVPVPDHAARFIAQPLQLLIGGKWMAAKSGKTFDVFDPSTGQPIAKAADGVVGVRMASTPALKLSSKSRLIRLRTFCARR